MVWLNLNYILRFYYAIKMKWNGMLSDSKDLNQHCKINNKTQILSGRIT